MNGFRLTIKVVLSAGMALLNSINGFGQVVAGFQASITEVCSGSAITFTNRSTGISDTTLYDWNFGAGASPSTATGTGPHVVIYTGSGFSTVSLTVTDTTSDTSTKTDYITVKSLPDPPVVTVTDNCNATSTLSTSAYGILLWSTMQSTSSIIVAAPGIYSVTTTVNGCTSLAGSGTAAPKISPDSPVVSVDCSLGYQEAVINITSPVGEGLEYRLDGGRFQSGTSFSEVTNGSHTITVRDLSGCTTTGDYFEVSCGCANPATVTLSSASGTTCDISPITVSGNTFGGIASYVFVTEDGEGSVSPSFSTSSPFSFTYTPKNKDKGKIIKITVTTNNPVGGPCVAAKETYLLSVNPSPDAPGIGLVVQPTCSVPTGDVVINGLPESGSWVLTRTPAGEVVQGVGTSIAIRNLVTGTYTFRVTNEAGCTSNSSDGLVIAAQPLPPPVPAQTIDCTLGFGKAVVTVTGPIGPGIQYSIDAGAFQSGISFANIANGSHFITARSSSGCETKGVDFIISCGCLNQPVIVLNRTSGTTCGTSVHTVAGNIFSGSATTLSITENGGGTVSPVITNTSPFSFTYTPSESDKGTEVTITLTTNNPLGAPCSAATAIYKLTVNAVPAIPVIGVITPPTCNVPAGSVVLNGLPATGTWILTRYPGEVASTGTGSSTTITGLLPGTYTYSVTSQGGCVSAISKSLVIPVATASPGLIITDPAASCSTSGADLTAPGITAGSPPGLTFTYWTNATATIAYPTPRSAGAGTYYVKGTATTGCFDIKPVTITVSESPKADAGKDQILFNQYGTTMEAGLLQNLETGAWSVVSGSAEFLDRKNPRTPVIKLSVDENKLLWKVTNGVCPESSDTVMIRVMISVNDLKIQTLITPNMDGRNDYFEVNGLNTSGNTELVVFDRRGLQVYKNANYDNSWNGVDYNEKPLPDDTYFYVIRQDNGSSIKGFIVIRR